MTIVSANRNIKLRINLIILILVRQCPCLFSVAPDGACSGGKLTEVCWSHTALSSDSCCSLRRALRGWGWRGKQGKAGIRGKRGNRGKLGKAGILGKLGKLGKLGNFGIDWLIVGWKILVERRWYENGDESGMMALHEFPQMNRELNGWRHEGGMGVRGSRRRARNITNPRTNHSNYIL